MISRRRFVGWSATGLLAACFSSITQTACSFASVVTLILKYVPMGLTAFTAILNLLAGFGIPTMAIAELASLVKSAFADLQVAIQQYDDAPAADKTTFLGKISTALSVVEAQLQVFWNGLTLPSPQAASLIQGLLGIIISTLQGFMPSLPAPASTDVFMKRASLAKLITVAPQRRSPSQFRSDFNSMVVAAGHSEAVI